MAPVPGSFINPHPSHAGRPGAAEVLWWVAVPAEALGRRPRKTCNPSLRAGTHRRRREINMGRVNEGDKGEAITKKRVNN